MKLPLKSCRQCFPERKFYSFPFAYKKIRDNYDNLINSCKTANPDYIFFTGDLYSRNEINLDHKLVLMKRLRTIAPVYYVFGNHEADTREKAEVLASKLEQCGINVLRNKKIRLYLGEDYINVYGADIESKYYKNSKGSYSNLPQLTVEKLGRMLGNLIRIILIYFLLTRLFRSETMQNGALI